MALPLILFHRLEPCFISLGAGALSGCSAQCEGPVQNYAADDQHIDGVDGAGMLRERPALKMMACGNDTDACPCCGTQCSTN